MLNISGLNKQSLGRFLDTLRDNYRETGEDPANEQYTHGPIIALVEGLVAAGSYIANGFESILEKPLNPLKPEQVDQLKSLEDIIPGLEMQPDKKSLKEDSLPSMLYAMYQGNWLGSCDGNRFIESDNAHSRPEHSQVTTRIHEVYKDEKFQTADGPYRNRPDPRDN